MCHLAKHVVPLAGLPTASAAMSQFIMPGNTLVLLTGTLNVPLDGTLQDGTVHVAGTTSAATLTFVGDTAVTSADPTLDGASLIDTAVPGRPAAGSTVLRACQVSTALT